MRGLAAARELGATTVLFGGGDGGPAAEQADHALVVPSDSTARMQELHVLLLHLILDQVDAWAAAEARVTERRLLHMIGNAHIDPVWLWQWPEGYQEVRATFQSAVDRLDEYPDFVFTCDSSLFFAWVEETDPALFERIREHVADGRLQVSAAGGSSPTATSRAASRSCARRSTGSATCSSASGSIATTGANLDSFGHNASIPQILARERLRLVRLPAPRPEGEGAREPALPLGVAGRVERGRLPDPARVLRAEGRHRRARRAGVATLPDGAATSGPSSTASATTAAGRRSRTSSRSSG